MSNFIPQTTTIVDTTDERLDAVNKFFEFVRAGEVTHNSLLYRPSVNLDRFPSGKAMTPVEMDTLCRLAYELLGTWLEVNSDWPGIDEATKEG